MKWRGDQTVLLVCIHRIVFNSLCYGNLHTHSFLYLCFQNAVVASLSDMITGIATIPSVQKLPKLLLSFLDARRRGAIGHGREQPRSNCKYRGGPEKIYHAL